MAVESLTINLHSASGDIEVPGEKYVSGDANDNQIVTLQDGGTIGSVLFSQWGDGKPTEPGAGPGGDDEFHFDLSGFDDDFKIQVEGLDSGDVFRFTNFDSYVQDGDTWSFYYTGSDGQPHVVKMSAASTDGTGVATVMVCFCRGSRITTEIGEVLVEDLVEGDLVLCSDGELRPIRWVGGSRLSAATLDTHPELRPIRIADGAFGVGRPHRDLKVSPQHKVLLSDWRAELLFGTAEVLVPAKFLINDSTIRPVRDSDGVEYFHILLDAHQTILANGLDCETLMPAELAQSALSSEARTEICTLFPDLVGDLSAYGPHAAPVLKRHEAEVHFGHSQA